MEDVVFIKVPIKYYNIYNTMLIAIAEYDTAILKPCKCKCEKYNELIECFNLYYSLIAACNLQDLDSAKTIAEFITQKLYNIGIKVKDIPQEPLKPVLKYYNGEELQNIVIEKQEDTYTSIINVGNTKVTILEVPLHLYISKAVLTSNEIDSDITDKFVKENNIYRLYSKYYFNETDTITIEYKEYE